MRDKPKGLFHHDLWCNADRCQPVGCDGCSCDTGKELKKLRAENKRLREGSQKVADRAFGLADEQIQALIAGLQQVPPVIREKVPE